MSGVAGTWTQGGRIGGGKEVSSVFDPQLAAEQALAVRRARRADIRAINAGILDPQEEAAIIFEMLRDQRMSAGILPSGVNGIYPGETPIDRLQNGAVIYAAEENFRGRTGESTDEIIARLENGDTDLRDVPFEIIEGLLGVAAVVHAPMFLVGLATPLALDAVKANLSGKTLENARNLAWLDVAPRLVKIVSGITALAVAASGIGIGGGVVKKLAEGNHDGLDQTPQNAPDGKPPIKALGLLAAASAFLAACEKFLKTGQLPTVEVTKVDPMPTATLESLSTSLPPIHTVIPTIWPSATVSPFPTATETLTPTPPEIPYGLDAWMPAAGGEEVSLTPLLVPERSLIDSHTENANYQLLIARVNRGAGEERVTGFRQCLPDGFCFSSVAAIDLSGDTDILGPDGKWYRMDVERSQNGVVRYGLVDGQTADQQEMEMVFVNVFRDADAMARRADGALVPVKIGTDGRISELPNEPNHFFFVSKGTSATVDLDAPGGRFVRIEASADQGGGTIWLDLVPAPTDATPPISPVTPTFMPPVSPVPPAIPKETETPPAPDTGTWPSRTSGPDSPRKTGVFTSAGNPVLTISWCREPDGTIRDQLEGGEPNGVKYMRTHVQSVNSDGTLSVYGSTALVNPRAVFIKNHPSNESISAGVGDLETGDCILVFGVQDPDPDDVYGVR